MNRLRIGLFWAGFFPSLMLLSSVAGAAQGYVVSYLWHHHVDAVMAYREQVGRLLGPAVEDDLKIVAKGDLFGLVYSNPGSRERAGSVARAHSRILQARGLEAAAPIRAQQWAVFGDVSTDRKTPEVAAAQQARRSMSHTERVQEVRTLEAAVEKYIKELRAEGTLAADERTGWSVYDFTTGEKLVTINEDMQFQSASLVKPFIAAAFFHQVKQGQLSYGPKSRRHMMRMIQHSNNASTNWITRQIGGPQAVERILKRHYPGIFRELHLVEYIPAGGRTYRNKASAHDYSRFLYAVWTDAIPGAAEIKRMMSLSASDRIYTGARDVPKGTKVYNKTGSTARVCADMGILSVRGRDGKRYPYTVIGIIEKQHPARNYTAWIRSRSDVIRNVSNIVYKGIAEYHDIEG